MNIPVAILTSAAVIGLLADLMLKPNFEANTLVGFGIPLITTAIAMATGLLACASRIPTRRKGLGFLIPAVVFSLAFILRDSPTLLFIDLGVIISGLAFASYSLMGTPLSTGGLTQYAAALVAMVLTPVFNTIELLVREINWNDTMSESTAKALRGVLSGLVIATPLVGIFTGLFLAADPAFAAITQKTFHFDLGEIASNLVIFSAFTWLSAGFLHGLSIFKFNGGIPALEEGDDLSSALLTNNALFREDRIGLERDNEEETQLAAAPAMVTTASRGNGTSYGDSISINDNNGRSNISSAGLFITHAEPLKLPKLTLGITETATALGSVNVLFAGFVAVQLQYLFGGASLIGITPGLSYADYVHKGFFELNLVVALVLPMLLVADSMLIRKTKIGDYVFKALAGTQIALVLVILASALQRMNLYQAEFGQSELRLYVTVFMSWLGTVCAIFAATVLTGKRQKFAFASYLSGIAILLGVNLANPDALIQSTNVALAKLRPRDVGLVLNEAPKNFDAAYATSLSSDGIQPLLDGLRELPAEKQKIVATNLLTKKAEEEQLQLLNQRDWRTFNLSQRLARKAINNHINELSALSKQ